MHFTLLGSSANGGVHFLLKKGVCIHYQSGTRLLTEGYAYAKDSVHLCIHYQRGTLLLTEGTLSLTEGYAFDKEAH